MLKWNDKKIAFPTTAKVVKLPIEKKLPTAIAEITITRNMVNENPYFKHSINDIFRREYEVLLLKVVKQCLGREPDFSKDKNRFILLQNVQTNQTFLAFDGNDIGEIIIDTFNCAITFEPKLKK